MKHHKLVKLLSICAIASFLVCGALCVCSFADMFDFPAEPTDNFGFWDSMQSTASGLWGSIASTVSHISSNYILKLVCFAIPIVFLILSVLLWIVKWAV